MDQQKPQPVSTGKPSIKSRLYQNVFVTPVDASDVHRDDASSLSIAVPSLSGKADSNLTIGKSVFIQDPSAEQDDNEETSETPGKKQVKIQEKPKTSATSTVVTRRNTAASFVKRRADVEFFKSIQSSSGYTFNYLKPAKSSSDPLYDPYDLEITDYETLDPSNYYTVSKDAVLHFFKGNSECTTVEQTLINMEFASKLRQIPLISKYQQFKAFKTWIHHVRRQRNGAAANYLKKNLCHLDPILRKALLEAKQQCLSFENAVSVISYPPQVTEFPHFVDIQKQNISESVIGHLQPFNDVVLNILKTCFTDSIKKQSDIFEKEVEATGVKIYKYTKRAAIRNTAKELVRFTKVVDYMVLSSINWWIVDGLTAFIKTIDTCAGDENLFKIDAIIKDDSLQLNPSQTEILGYVDVVFQLVPTCLKDLNFHSNTCISLIEAEILDNSSDPSQHVDLGDILFSNINWKESTHNSQLALEKQLFEVHKYLDSMKHFQDVYRFNSAFDLNWVNIKSDASMDSVEAWLRDCEQHLSKSQKEITEITSIPSKWQFKSLKVDLEPLKVTLLPMSAKNLEQIRTAFPVALNSRCESQMKSITVLIDSLQKTPVVIGDYVARLSNLDDSQNLTESYDRSTALIDQGISLARNNGCQMPSELLTLSQNFSNAIYQLKDAIDLAYQSKEHICHQFALDLDKAVQHLQTQAVHCRNEAMNPKIFNLSSNPTDNLTMLERLSKSINELSNLSTTYESYIKRFELNTTKKASLDSIKTDIETKKELWTVFVSWKQQEKAWRQQSYSSVDIDALKRILDGFSDRVKNISEILPSNDVVSDLQNSINHLLKLHPILNDLANPAMKLKHSDRLQSQIGKLAVLKDRELPFSKLVDSTLIKFADTVHEISTQATEEARLERLVSEIATRWNDQERMPLVTHQNHADLFVVADTKPLQLLLQKDRETIVSIGPSPYREHVQADVEQWSAFIDKADEMLSMCSNFQNIWNHLEHHFSVASARKELPDEARLFTRLDRSWRDIVRKMAKDPVIPRLTQNTDMVEKIKELLDTGTECYKKVVSGLGRRQPVIAA